MLAAHNFPHTIDRFLSAGECAAAILLAETAGFGGATVRTKSGNHALPHIRNNDRAMVPAGPWRELLWGRLLTIALPELDGEHAVGLPEELRFYRYRSGQRFKMHKDGPWNEAGLTSKLTFLVFLNEDFDGGGTDFRGSVVQPATGMALLFPHATWHEGMTVTAGTKYVLRSDILYSI